MKKRGEQAAECFLFSAGNSDTNSVAKSYVGCLRRVYFGAVNLLADLRKSGRRSTSLRSLNTGIAVPVEAAYSCLDVGEKDLAVTLLSPFASVDVPATAPYKVLQLNFRLPKNNRHNPEPGTLVSGDVLTGGANGQFRVSQEQRTNLDISRWTLPWYSKRNLLVQVIVVQTLARSNNLEVKSDNPKKNLILSFPSSPIYFCREIACTAYNRLKTCVWIC